MVSKPTLFNFMESAVIFGFGVWLVFRDGSGWILITLATIGFALKWRALK